MATKNSLNLTPNLFGMPYQFTDKVDPRVSDISEILGKEFVENMILEAPVCTFIPGSPSYLSNASTNTKIDTAMAMLSNNGKFNGLNPSSSNVEEMRLYDFKSAYADYIKYVNILCRSGAVFLDLDDSLMINGVSSPLKSFNWAKFKWSKMGNSSVTTRLIDAAGAAFSFSGNNDATSAELDALLANYNFVQFYIDADVSVNESMNNTTSESMMKSLFDSGSSTMKELAFMANSGLGDDIMNFAEESADAFTSGINSILGGDGAVKGALSRIINLGGEVLKGNNVIIPDVYQSSAYSKSYSITVHLKSPYGSKLGYYLNVFVPLMHLIALCLPKQSTSNSYASPFIVKAYVDGVFSCNMGIVEGISISRSAEAWSVDGLPTEVDVSIELKDLYSSMSMTPSSSPNLFIHNSSLVEYLAVNCGLDLTVPNMTTKLNFAVEGILSSFSDIPTNITATISENINRFITDALRLYN